MVAYTFYWIDETEKVHYIGLLPERRKHPERITQESIINFGKTILGNNANINNILFIQVTLDEITGKICWPKPSIATYKSV